jgi:hypothetical protein
VLVTLLGLQVLFSGHTSAARHTAAIDQNRPLEVGGTARQ